MKGRREGGKEAPSLPPSAMYVPCKQSQPSASRRTTSNTYYKKRRREGGKGERRERLSKEDKEREREGGRERRRAYLVDELSALGVVALSPIVPGAGLTEHEVVCEEGKEGRSISKKPKRGWYTSPSLPPSLPPSLFLYLPGRKRPPKGPERTLSMVPGSKSTNTHRGT